MARALFDAVWVDLDGRCIVAVQMKSTLHALRNVLRTAEETGSSDATYNLSRK
jgi:hypothetical protein